MSKVVMKNHVRLLAFFSGVSAIALVLLSIFWLIQDDGKVDFLDVFVNSKNLSKEQLSIYSNQLNIAFSIVSIYLIGHFSMWLGYSLIIYKRNNLLSYILLAIGFLATLADFTEYATRFAIFELIKNHVLENHLIIGFWLIVRQLSIWLIFLGSVLVSISIFRIDILLLALLGLVTIPLMYVFALSKVWYLWLITWHLLSSMILWRSKYEK